MKRILFMLLIFLAFAACRKETTPETTLVGTWKLDKVVGTSRVMVGDWVPANAPRTIIFRADGSFSDPGRPDYTHFKHEGDYIFLTNANATDTFALHVVEFKANTLAYLLPTTLVYIDALPGEKLKKIR